MSAVKKIDNSNFETVTTPKIITSSTEHFTEMVEWGFYKRKLKAPTESKVYLVGVLEKFLNSNNLFEADSFETLAESYLKARTSDSITKNNLLKKLADKTLYICGYFGDSLNRKLVDVDYYVDMGGLAYKELAFSTREENLSAVYIDFSKRFVNYVDVLTHISEYSFIKSDNSVLRIYERYLKTGSKLAQEKLTEMGVVTIDPKQKKQFHQD
jgi:hypothetical protein